ncbi:MAG: hypothetical protein J0L62_08685 [Bacteroidetes bacterium]|nr:hypothetical protein [Bacteroidota bacterium]
MKLKSVLLLTIFFCAGSVFGQISDSLNQKNQSTFTVKPKSKDLKVLKTPDAFYSETVKVLSLNDRVSVVDSMGSFYKITSENGDFSGFVPKSSVLRPDQINSADKIQIVDKDELLYRVELRKTDLIIGILALGLAWDYAFTTSDMNKALQKIDKSGLSINTDNLKSSRNTKFTLAAIFGLVGLYEVYSSVSEVKTNP